MSYSLLICVRDPDGRGLLAYGDSVNEAPLSGGRVTQGVVRVGNTVRRPRKPNSELVRVLLGRFEELGLELAPRYLGVDDQGREMFSYLDGEVPDELDAAFSDATVVAAARLIRRFHDATDGSQLAEGLEVVCHNDLSPCNTVFRDGVPVALIDFDNAAPGKRLDDLGYALFLWLNIGTDGPDPSEQRRRINVFCGAYGLLADARLVAAIVSAVTASIERLNREARLADVQWWQRQLGWVERQRGMLSGT